MIGRHGHDPAMLLDHRSIATLQRDVGPVVTVGVIDRFVAMLDSRTDRIRRATAGDDAAELQAAVLSLCTSAAMLGAHALATAAGQLAEAEQAYAAALGCLEQLARQTATALGDVRAAVPAGVLTEG